MPLPALVPALMSGGMKALMAYWAFTMAQDFGIFNKWTQEGQRGMSAFEATKPAMGAPYSAAAELGGMRAGVDTMETMGEVADVSGRFRKHQQSVDMQNLGNVLAGKQALLTRASSLRPDYQQKIAALVESGAL
jgi:hypothetical protein